MNRDELAVALAQANEDERWRLLQRYPLLLDTDLARVLKQLYDAAESSDPTLAAGAATALLSISEATAEQETTALAQWTVGMAAIDSGQMEAAIVHLNNAQVSFLSIQQPHAAAATQVSKLIALAILGRYDEAIACGLQTRDLFLELDDTLAAGKIEQNLGNIFHRRGQYIEAEKLLRSAWTRFDNVSDQKQLAQVENCLGIELMFQHRFRDAEFLYEQALHRAEAAGLILTQAEIECNLGNLALFQGRYDRALAFLERSRRRYAELDLPHELAIAELELADAYLELNLLQEAERIYERVISTFDELGMRAEQGHALAQYGRVHLLRGQHDEAYKVLVQARDIYREEGNEVGAAVATLIQAQIEYTQGHYATAQKTAASSEAVFALAGAGSSGRALIARWIQGEALRAQGQYEHASALYASILQEAEAQTLPQIAQQCYTSLGLLAVAQGELLHAKEFFRQAVALVEQLRAPLPSEEFRAEFIADKLTPYAQLVRLCLTDGATDSPQVSSGDRATEALEYAEQARARTLVDTLSGSLLDRYGPRDSFEANLLNEADALRSELNWLYTQINDPANSNDSLFQATIESWRVAAREKESALLRQMRQLEQIGTTSAQGASAWRFRVSQLQRQIGVDTVVVEYFCLDGELLAFIITHESVQVVQHLGRETDVEAALHSLQFQMGALRYRLAWSPAHANQLKQRTRHHLHQLYTLLLSQLEPWLQKRRIAIVPYRSLHYVPFHALYDGTHYLIERCEVSYAPSAAVLQHCLKQPQTSIEHALLVGASNEQVPKVRDEVETIAAFFPRSTVLLDEEATVAAVEAHAPHADLIHLACHGQFRADSPLFSSLRLGDGWLTVRDAASLQLDCALVVLSACETGMSAVMPGDEMIGLARSFFSAGTAALMVSLWTVDDETTADFMTLFYSLVRRGETPSAALRHTQCAFLQEELHPFFWASFVLIGRW